MPKTAILSSRDYLCVNPLIKNSSGGNINLKCKIARSKKECRYFHTVESVKVNGYDCIDIDEMKKIGENSNFCPFYFQRKKKEIADIIFLPYNYVFDQKLLRILKINLTNSILIIDEAHNIENVCESAYSAELSTKTIDSCIDDLKQISILVDKSSDLPDMNNKGNQNSKDFISSIDAKKLRENEMILTSIKLYMKNQDVQQGNFPNIGKKLSPKDLFFLIFEGSKKDDKNQSTLLDFIPKSNNIPKTNGFEPGNLEEHIKFLSSLDQGLSDIFNKNSNLLNYIDFLNLIRELHVNYTGCLTKQSISYNIDNDYDCLVNNYKIYILDEEENSKNTGNNPYNQKNMNTNLKTRKISLFCMNPGLGFKHILDSGVISTILTSGTLAPMKSMESELKCEFKVMLENTHVIDKAQMNFSILSKSLKKSILFDFRASNRNNDMNEELGHTICDLVKVSPQGSGILCFFTSYAFMNSCVDTWTKKSILSEIEKTKEIFKDMQNQNNKNVNIIKSFNDSCSGGGRMSKGGILFSVFRGSSSEGIDFSDDKARMVIIVGIPYPNLGDIKVNLKKEFLDEYNRRAVVKQPSLLKLKSNDWYLQCALRAVNQAIGRVIRHFNDFGSMVLIDFRYKEMMNQNAFSLWLRDSSRFYDDVKIVVETKNFFEKMKSKKINLLILFL